MKHLFWPRTKNIRPCLVYFFSSLNFRHLSLITQNTLPVWQNHSLVITQYFSYYLWVPYLSHCAGFFFFFHLVSLNPVKKKKRTELPTRRRKGKKKRVKSGQKVGLVLFVSPLCVFNYNIVIEL